MQTDAHQTVNTFILDEDENRVDAGPQIDGGYNTHSGNGNFAKWFAETFGCIRVEPDTMTKLESLYNTSKATGGTMTIVVQD